MHCTYIEQRVDLPNSLLCSIYEVMEEAPQLGFWSSRHDIFFEVCLFR